MTSETDTQPAPSQTPRARRIVKFGAVIAFAPILTALVLFYAHSFIGNHTPAPFGTRREGTIFYDRLRARDGYNLVNLYGDNAECRILDMEGHLVYEFEQGLCHLYADGSLVVLATAGTIRYYGPDTRLLWDRPYRAHHDFDVSADEQEMFFHTLDVRKFRGQMTWMYAVDGLDRKGNSIFHWQAEEHLEEIEKAAGIPVPARFHDNHVEFLHLNSVQILPPNPHEATHPEFHRGNILINSNIPSIAMILDRKTGAIVWSRRLGDDTLLPDGTPRENGAHTLKMLANGNLFYFHNTAREPKDGPAFSRIIEMDPLTEKVVWEYRSDPTLHFFNPVWGSVYRLDNGNVLISSSINGSAFEITSGGRVVWEWVNPDKDKFGLAVPVYRVSRVDRDRVERVVDIWKKVR